MEARPQLLGEEREGLSWGSVWTWQSQSLLLETHRRTKAMREGDRAGHCRFCRALDSESGQRLALPLEKTSEEQA